jgi:hypothetical protein
MNTEAALLAEIIANPADDRLIDPRFRPPEHEELKQRFGPRVRF